MPEEWRSSKMVPIFKNKGGIQDYSDYRGTKLTSHVKIWERIIDRRLKEKVSISGQQFDFHARQQYQRLHFRTAATGGEVQGRPERTVFNVHLQKIKIWRKPATGYPEWIFGPVYEFVA